MIIKLTQAEVHRFVASKLDLAPDTFTIEITDCAPSAARQAIDVQYALRCAIRDFPRYGIDEKISCIKRFRDLCPKAPDVNGALYPVVGLRDAKWAIENVPAALRNLELTGHLGAPL